MHPDERCVLAISLVDRRKEVRRNFESIRPALVRDLLKLISAGCLGRVGAVGAVLLRDLTGAHVRRAAAQIARRPAHVELPRAQRIHVARPRSAAATAAPGTTAPAATAAAGCVLSQERRRQQQRSESESLHRNPHVVWSRRRMYPDCATRARRDSDRQCPFRGLLGRRA